MNKSNNLRSFYEGMDYHERIFFASSSGNASSFAYRRLIQHRRSAAIQIDRIYQSALQLNDTMPEQPDLNKMSEARDYLRTTIELLDPIFADIHYYFVAWDNCSKMMKSLSRLPEFNEAQKFFYTVRKEFDHYSNGRNSFEHFDDRLPGGKKYATVKEIRRDPKAGLSRNFGGLEGSFFTFSDKSWDVTSTSLALLNNYVGEFLHVLHTSIDELLSQQIKGELK